ncbi:hypothetical protein IEO21_03376 [Rhodonia placenta]|uniref:Uncharacterized protein n=1 Tax=Rhodonia placenta TaxID=104341 RepID=A0A8H7P5Z6_9APHY|nr:hypothetical protein IEO21_03376 [Postia placenta]
MLFGASCRPDFGKS